MADEQPFTLEASLLKPRILPFSYSYCFLVLMNRISIEGLGKASRMSNISHFQKDVCSSQLQTSEPHDDYILAKCSSFALLIYSIFAINFLFPPRLMSTSCLVTEYIPACQGQFRSGTLYALIENHDKAMLQTHSTTTLV